MIYINTAQSCLLFAICKGECSHLIITFFFAGKLVDGLLVMRKIEVHDLMP